MEDDTVMTPVQTEESKECKLNITIEKQRVNSLLMASVIAPSLGETAKRGAVDLVAIIDKSGSMQGSKLKLVQETMSFMIQQLSSQDKLAIVLFGTNVEILIPLTQMTEQGKDIATDKVNRIMEEGMTNMYGGLLAGLELIMKRPNDQKNPVASVMLFTDGLETVSGLEPTNVMAQKTINEIKDPCTIFTFGYGTDHDAAVLQKIATIGGGVYYYVQSEEMIAGAFADCLGGLLTTVVQNVKLVILPQPSVIIKKIFTKYVVITDEESSEILIGDLYSEERRDILMEIEVPENHTGSIASSGLQYFNLISSQLHGFLVQVQLTPCDHQQHIQLDVQKNRVMVAQGLENANFLASGGKVLEAVPILQNLSSAIKASSSVSDPTSQSLLLDVDQCLKGLNNYHQVGSKMLIAMGNSHWQQRSNNARDSTYQNSGKKSMISKIEKERRKQILHCEKCGLTGHYARECQQANPNSPEAELQRNLQQQKCTMCGKVGHLSVNCLQLDQDSCHVCGEKGHLSSSCIFRDVCHFCKERGHFSSACPKKNSICHLCKNSGHFAKDCKSAPQTSSGSTCHNCGKPGHISRDCKACSKCGQLGHFARDCSSPGKCSNCGKPGHFSRECKEMKTCSKCGQPGHFARECSQKRRG